MVTSILTLTSSLALTLILTLKYYRAAESMGTILHRTVARAIPAIVARSELGATVALAVR